MTEYPYAASSLRWNMFIKSFEKVFGFTHRLFGYFCMTVEGWKPESFINRLNQKKLRIWKLKTTGKNKLSFRCTLFNAYKIVSEAKTAGYTLTIDRGVGLPFVINKYRARTGLVVGTILSALLIMFSGFFIWDVRLTSGEMTPELYAALAKVGCHSGQYIPTYDIDKAKMQFLLDNDEYSFFSVNIRGTVAYVELKKRYLPDDKNDEDFTYCHIVASDDAQIIDITATKGVPIVKPGDVVEKGEKLVNGEPADKFGVIHPVRSEAIVNAKVKKTIEVKIPLTQETKRYTGSESKKTSIVVFGKKINLYFGELPNYEFSDAEFSFERLTAFGVVRLPIDAFSYTYREFMTEEILLSEEEAAEIAEQAFQNEIETLMDGGILLSVSKEGKIDTAEENYILSGEVTVIKDIAVQEPFDYVPPEINEDDVSRPD